MTDPRPADLTAQEREAIRQAGLRAFPDCIEASVDELLAFLGAAIAAVPRLAAPSRGQGAGTTVGGANVSCTMINCGGRCGYPGCQPPAPVASPEAGTKCDCGDVMTQCSDCAVADYQASNTDCGRCCVRHNDPRWENPDAVVPAIAAPPAGPETGWLTMTAEEGAAVESHVDMVAKLFEPSRADRFVVLAHAEIVALRAALSAATERAEAAERERDTISCNAIPSSPACEDGLDRRKYNEPVCWSCYSAVTGRLHATEDLLTASESRCAAALKLAGVAVEMIGATPNAQPITDSRVAEYMSLRSRLASLSSPSAPESGNTEGTDAAP